MVALESTGQSGPGLSNQTGDSKTVEHLGCWFFRDDGLCMKQNWHSMWCELLSSPKPAMLKVIWNLRKSRTLMWSLFQEDVCALTGFLKEERCLYGSCNYWKKEKWDRFYYYSLVAQVEGSRSCIEIIGQALGTNLICYSRCFPKHLWEDANYCIFPHYSITLLSFLQVSEDIRDFYLLKQS